MFDPLDRAQEADVLVIGGGLAGLTAAAVAAWRSSSVLLLERSSDLGGRAGTQVRDGVYFNHGPHALYCAGRAFRLMHDLGVPFSGHFPGGGRAPFALLKGKLAPLPATLRTVLTSRILSLREKWRLIRFFSGLAKIDTAPLDRMPLADWITRTAGTGNLAHMIGFLFRVSTFANDPARASAGAALRQLQLANEGNVWYLDRGWQTLVDGLAERARSFGAVLRTSSPVESIEETADGVRVRLRGDDVVTGRTAILAVPPQAAAHLTGSPELARVAEEAHPVTAACLDVALERLPHPERTTVFGLDEPLYYSVHSAAADLAPPGVALVHVMKYLGASDLPAADVQAELIGLLNLVQPGWRQHVLDQRFLPRMTVTSGLVTAEQGGLKGRHGIHVPGRENLFVAGDWVGGEGMLADAAVASGEQAALAAIARRDDLMPLQLDRSECHAGR